MTKMFQVGDKVRRKPGYVTDVFRALKGSLSTLYTVEEVTEEGWIVVSSGGVILGGRGCSPRGLFAWRSDGWEAVHPAGPPQIGDRIRIVREGVVTRVGWGTNGKGVSYKVEGYLTDFHSSLADVVEVVERAPYVPEAGDRFTFVNRFVPGHPWTFHTKSLDLSGKEVWLIENNHSGIAVAYYPQPSDTFKKVDK